MLGIKVRQVIAYVMIILINIHQIAIAEVIVDPSAQAIYQSNIIDDGINPIINNIPDHVNGLSRSDYIKLDIDNRGMNIINDPFQNSNLTTTPASVIFFNINSASNTTISGLTKIIGPGADLIISNANGITCSGCRFQNIPNLNLTTESGPNISGSAISFNNPASSPIIINNDGLVTDGNALLKAKNLVVNGQITASGLLKLEAMDADTNGMAIDGSALGAMNAGQIQIVSHGNGFGVNLPAKITSGNNVTITANGSIVTGEIAAGSKGSGNIVSIDGSNVKTGKIAADKIGINQNNYQTISEVEIGGDIGNGNNIGNINISGNNVKINSGAQVSAALLSINANNDIINNGILNSSASIISANNLYNYGLIKSLGLMTLKVDNEYLGDNGSIVEAGNGLMMINRTNGAMNKINLISGKIKYQNGATVKTKEVILARKLLNQINYESSTQKGDLLKFFISRKNNIYLISNETGKQIEHGMALPFKLYGNDVYYGFDQFPTKNYSQPWIKLGGTIYEYGNASIFNGTGGLNLTTDLINISSSEFVTNGNFILNPATLGEKPKLIMNNMRYADITIDTNLPHDYLLYRIMKDSNGQWRYKTVGSSGAGERSESLYLPSRFGAVNGDMIANYNSIIIGNGDLEQAIAITDKLDTTNNMDFINPDLINHNITNVDFTIKNGVGYLYSSKLNYDPNDFKGLEDIVDGMGGNRTNYIYLVDSYLLQDQLEEILMRELGISNTNQDMKTYVATLVTNAVNAGNNLGLQIGVALTNDQIAQVVEPIIWPVTEQINGIEVLVPKLYIPASVMAGANKSALITADNLSLSLDKGLYNNGSIQANNTLTIASNGEVINTGNIYGQNSATITATGNIQNSAKLYTSESGNNYNSYITNQGSIGSGGNVTITSNNGKVEMQGGNVNAGGNAFISGQQGVDIGTISLYNENHIANKNHKHDQISITNIGSNINAGQNININSGSDTTITGSTLEAQQRVDITSTGKTIIASSQDYLESFESNKKDSLISSSTKNDYLNSIIHNSSLIKAGTGITIHGDTGVDILASKVMTDVGNANITTTSGHQINILAGHDIITEQHQEKKSGINIGVSGSKFHYAEISKDKNKSYQEYSHGSQIYAGGNVNLEQGVGGKVNIVGSSIIAGNNITAHDVSLLADSVASNSSHQHTSMYEGIGVDASINGVWLKGGEFFDINNSKNISQSHASSSLKAGNDINLAGNNIFVGSSGYAGHDIKAENGTLGLYSAEDVYSNKSNNINAFVGVKAGGGQSITTSATQIGNNISKVDGPDNWRSTVTDLGAAKNIYDGIKNGKEAIGLINAGKMPIKGGIYATAEVDIDTSKLKGITQSASNLTAGNNINLDLDKVDIVGSNLRANNELSGRIGELNIISKPDTQGSSHSHGHANIDISLYGTPGVNFGLYGEEGGSSFSGVTNQASATGSKVNLRVGHTNLEGGLLASTDENGKDLGQLHLETDTLTYSNVEYKNENQTIGTGITTDGENHNQDSHRIKLEDGITKGETLATIGQGELIVNDGTDTSDLNRDVENTLVISKDEQASVDVTVTKEELQKVAEITKEVVKEVAEIAKDAASTITNVINGSMPAANEYQANMYEAAAMASKEYNLNAEDREKAAVVANAVLSGEISLADFDMKCLSQAQNWSIMDLFVARAYAMCAAGAVVLVPGVGEVVLGAAAVAGVVYIVDKVASKVAEQVKSGGDKAGVTGSPMPDPNDNHDSDHDDRDRSKNKGKENIQFRNEEKLDSHYNKHKNEWNNLSKDEYINKIYNLKNKLPDETNILEFKRDNGDIMKYDVRNNEFLVVDKNGYTKTLFRPEKGVDYWKQEILKWK